MLQNVVSARTGIVITLITAAAALGNSQTSETIIAFSVALVIFFGYEIQMDPPKLSTLDNNLAGLFLSEMSSDSPIVQFIEHQNFNNQFETEKIQALRSFVHKWDCPDHSFSNRKIHKSFSKLLQAWKNLCVDIGHLTYHVKELKGMQWVRPSQDWLEDERYKKMREDATQLNKLSIEAFDAYKALFRELSKYKFDLENKNEAN